MKNDLKELLILYRDIRPEIKKRLELFRTNFDKMTDDDLFSELSFCTLTPQSKARSCWKAIEHLKDTGFLYSAGKDVLSKNIAGVRFHNNKSAYIEANRRLFYSMNFKQFILDNVNDIPKLRKWLVSNIKGYSFKEAGHFLRNIGFGSDIAILDRHILKNMVKYGVINEIPESINEKTYLDLEKKLLEFSNKSKIPPDHLDMLFWYKQTGEIFK